MIKAAMSILGLFDLSGHEGKVNKYFFPLPFFHHHAIVGSLPLSFSFITPLRGKNFKALTFLRFLIKLVYGREEAIARAAYITIPLLNQALLLQVLIYS